MILIKNCKLINLAGINKENMDILIDGKLIKEIKNNIEVKNNYEIIDANNKLVTPGLIESHCHMGVYDTAVESGIDGNESSDPVLPGLRGVDAINPIDPAFYVARKYGITTVVTGPGSANIMGGTFSAIKTSDEDLEDRIVSEEVAMKMALGENPKKFYGSKGKSPKTRMMNAALMRENLEKAKQYYDKYKSHIEDPSNEKPKYDFHLHSLMRVYDGLRVKIHAHQSDDIMTAIRVSEEFGIRYSIEHTTDGESIIDYLVNHKVPCIIGPSAGFKSKYELKNKGFRLGALMEKKGIDFAITTDHPVIPIEGLLMQVMLYIKNGLSKEKALEAITINAAKLADIDDRVGSLEVGKDADIVIWDVEPFDTMHQVNTVLINGKIAYKREEVKYDFDYKKC